MRPFAKELCLPLPSLAKEEGVTHVPLCPPAVRIKKRRNPASLERGGREGSWQPLHKPPGWPDEVTPSLPGATQPRLDKVSRSQNFLSSTVGTHPLLTLSAYKPQSCLFCRSRLFIFHYCCVRVCFQVNSVPGSGEGWVAKGMARAISEPTYPQRLPRRVLPWRKEPC